MLPQFPMLLRAGTCPISDFLRPAPAIRAHARIHARPDESGESHRLAVNIYPGLPASEPQLDA